MWVRLISIELVAQFIEYAYTVFTKLQGRELWTSSGNEQFGRAAVRRKIEAAASLQLYKPRSKSVLIPNTKDKFMFTIAK